MMNDIDIHYATESEAVGLAHLNIASFRHQIMWRNALPGTDPEVCIPMKHARCLEKLASPDVHVFSAVDTSTDHIVGYARWTIPWEENKVELSEEGSAMVANAASLKPQEIRDEIWTETFTRMKEKRAVHITKDDMVLDLLAILPEYQGKGIGSKLLRWGIQQADARNARIYLEATIEGYPLYHKYGWYEDIPEAVECVQTAFADDPYFHWLFDSSEYNIQRNAASLAAHFQYGLNCDTPMYVAKVPVSDKHPRSVVGVSWWFSPRAASTPVSWSVWAQDWLLSFRQFLFNVRFGGRGGLNLHRYTMWKDLQRRTHDVVWTDPRGYYFCNVLAVSSEMRGMGLGRKLVEIVTQQADRDGMPCYLESSKGVPNLIIYEKLGFNVATEIDCVDGNDACKLYCMVRKPKAKA
ncbi:acyl-CoA N-acyltransferase [Aspergillus bertholletiae]|uniref:Acyl-CoA N-acyltransferase n=1 Tax=Aspergillus bertholletiae TaxID=1226010 RepID=A0A5N7AQS4_9EURO|nr:acyl-CoA N-acyltransferase [Aspergillus bertholletiae]